jgi:acetyl esterase/lipase
MSAPEHGAALIRALLGAILACLAGCQSLEFALANAPTVIGPFERRAGIAYGELPRQHLDVYRPRGPAAAAGKAPVVVFWYGGSWDSGSKEQYRFVGAALARAGCLAVLPDYRLFPQARFPEFVDDAARALAWVHAHAAQLGGDPERVFVMGHSAGAHQAAMLAFDPRSLARVGGDRRWIAGFIGISGPYALVPNSPELRTIFAPPYAPADWQPVASAGRGAPPSLLLHGLADDVVLPAQARALEAALRAADVPVQLKLYAGRGHADTIAAFSWVARSRASVLADALEFIERTGPLH